VNRREKRTVDFQLGFGDTNLIMFASEAGLHLSLKELPAGKYKDDLVAMVSQNDRNVTTT
jgi:hypothetical protein